MYDKLIVEELERVISEATYPDRPRRFMMPLELAERILSMLKAQEPKAPGVWKSQDEIVAGHYHEISVCPFCGFTTDMMSRRDMAYCPECGSYVPESEGRL